MLSVIIPAYNEEKMVPKAASVIADVLEQAGIDYELIFINDGSKDLTWPAIENACHQNPRVRGILFSRNFGKEAAMFAGLEKAEGDCVVLIDCDLQHPPEKIVEMYRLWEQGYEVIEGVKEDRGKENFFHRCCANAFYKIISRMTKIDMSNASDFKLLDRRVVDILNSLPEKQVFFRALSSWVGFKTTHVPFKVQERQEGVSKWSPWALFKYAFNNISAFSAAPMQIVTVLGIIFLIFAIILGIQSLINFAIGNAADGFTTVILIELIIGSVVMTSIGIVGFYIAKIYEEIKGRPRYIIAQEIGKDETELGEAEQ